MWICKCTDPQNNEAVSTASGSSGHSAALQCSRALASAARCPTLLPKSGNARVRFALGIDVLFPPLPFLSSFALLVPGACQPCRHHCPLPLGLASASTSIGVGPSPLGHESTHAGPTRGAHKVTTKQQTRGTNANKKRKVRKLRGKSM
eukprot:2535382-Amphidinium_carterae.1